MKNRVLTRFASFLLVAVMCAQLVVEAQAVSAKPTDIATQQNVLEVLSQYAPDAYHIVTVQSASGMDFMVWFMGQSIISGMDAAIHETYHGYTYSQHSAFYEQTIYAGGGKKYDMDCSVAFGSSFTKTEEMARNIPAQLQTFRYNTYVAPGAEPTANQRGVFGLLNEFSAYYWGLATMNSLVQFLIDTDCGEEGWKAYVSSIGNNMIAYSEFKYWTLRYMLYIQSANPALYQNILANKNYCAAYRDIEEQFVSEIARSRTLVDNCAPFLREKGLSIRWSDVGIYLMLESYGIGNGFGDYNILMAELEKEEYKKMDSILKSAGGARPQASAFTDVKPGTFYEKSVNWAVENGITNGTGNNTFSPDRDCTHVEILTFLWRAAGKPTSNTPCPVALSANVSYAESALRWAAEKGMINSKFQPNTPCTRADAVNYIWQAADRQAARYDGRFTDVPVNAPYATAVAWGVANKVVYGTSTTTFDPSGVCNRGQIVTLLQRCFDK